MILITLLSHQWKSFWRSRSATKSLVVQLIMGLLMLYLLTVITGVGFFLRELIKKASPGEDPVKVFCGGILYYFSADILIRFLLQELPALVIQPYLVQNIRRGQLIRFLNLRSLFTFLNLLPLLLFMPFTLQQIRPEYGVAAMTGFIVSIFFLTAFNHFLILYIKRKTILSVWWMTGFFALAVIFGVCDHFRIFSLSHASSVIFARILSHPWLALFPVVMAAAAFINNYYFLYHHLFLEDITGNEKRRKGAEYAFLNRFGLTGELIALDVKLMLRNKRPRSVLMMSFVFLFYGLFFYKQIWIEKGQWGFMLVGAIFVTGIFIVNYGQFLFAWQSSHFDGLMTANLPVRTYIKSKFALFTAFSTIALFLTSFYVLISWKLIFLQLAAYFYNIGINSIISVYFATRSYKAIDIEKKAAFNYQGMGATQWIYPLFTFAIPVLLYLPFSWLGGPWAGVVAVGVLGLISYFLQDWWIDQLARGFAKRKYSILEGFREK